MSLKFKIALIFAFGLAIAFSINLIIAAKTIHTQKEEDVEKVLTHLLVESNDEYISSVLTPSSDLNFLYTIPHNMMILSDSEVNALRFMISTNPYRTNEKFIVSSIKLANNYYLNAISDHRKIDEATYKYTQVLIFRYVVSLIIILLITIVALDFYMKPLEQLAIKTKTWKRENPYDFVLDDASSEIKEVSSAFEGLVKRLESYRQKETELFKEAAHELKTPLALMRSRLDVYEVSDHYEKDKFIADLGQDIERLTRELKNVLFLESSDFEESSTIDIIHVFKMLERKMDILIQRKGLKLELPTETFTVVASEKLLFKVLSALLENAITYAREDTIVEVGCLPLERKVWIYNKIGTEKYLFSSKIGEKILKRLRSEIGFDYKIDQNKDSFQIELIFFPA
ncbi:HAMP domain-containing sensor histidine kinase [Sulfuricurvum sp. PD_MW2]|uniref:sensor histidine kinase n=1 Tax=Sulfuricurvum sp. PD_MW2 TaxID=2027917 RepID=UPI0025EABE8D|nr:HAMP domain-containing sensor histidine kinase [Sulfuricurvum sp. PD_MW2]